MAAKWFNSLDTNSIVRPEELILPTFDIKTKNLPRENFDKQLDAIAAKVRHKEDQLFRDKAVRVQLDRKKIIISAVIFPVGKFDFSLHEFWGQLSGSLVWPQWLSFVNVSQQGLDFSNKISSR